MNQDTSESTPAGRGNARGEVTRSRLLDAALRSFATRGFHGTSTRDIADAAGMSPAAVYIHYRTKEELLFQLSLSGHRQVREIVDGAAAESTRPDEQIRQVVERYTAWHARHHTMAHVVQHEMPALNPTHAEEIATIRRGIEARIRKIVTTGADAGCFEVSNPAMTALAILSLGIDVARWYREDGAWSPDEIGNEYGELTLRMLTSRR